MCARPPSSSLRLQQLSLHACNICRRDPYVSLQNFQTTAIIFRESLPRHILMRGIRWPYPTLPPSAIAFIFSQSLRSFVPSSGATFDLADVPSHSYPTPVNIPYFLFLQTLLSRVLVCNFPAVRDGFPFSGAFCLKGLEGSIIKEIVFPSPPIQHKGCRNVFLDSLLASFHQGLEGLITIRQIRLHFTIHLQGLHLGF